MRAAIFGVIASAGVIFGASVYADEGSDLGFSDSQTDRAVEVFQSGAAACADAPVIYRVDCLQQVYSGTVRMISKASAYWEAEVALTRVGRSLYSFVRANTDKAAGKQKIGGYRSKGVSEASLPAARALYVQNLDKALGVMRSGSTSETRYFGPIADAVEATRDILN